MRYLRARLWVAGRLLVDEKLTKANANEAPILHQGLIREAEKKGRLWYLEISDPKGLIETQASGDPRATSRRLRSA